MFKLFKAWKKIHFQTKIKYMGSVQRPTEKSGIYLAYINLQNQIQFHYV